MYLMSRTSVRVPKNITIENNGDIIVDKKFHVQLSFFGIKPIVQAKALSVGVVSVDVVVCV
jgi:hypothetical protein